MAAPVLLEESPRVLRDYARIPISFEVRSAFRIRLLKQGLGGVTLSEQTVAKPWVKDYDAFEGEGPTRWVEHWDIRNWGVISAFVDNARVGGCTIAYDTPGVDKLEGRKDIAALWDIRIHPDHRHQGIGTKLMDAAVAWAVQHRCRLLKVETQNINVPACRFYAKCGFTLGLVNRYAYSAFPDEVELVWYRELG
jgi:GNAT superfamily N-acetyltransferase